MHGFGCWERVKRVSVEGERCLLYAHHLFLLLQRGTEGKRRIMFKRWYIRIRSIIINIKHTTVSFLRSSVYCTPVCFTILLSVRPSVCLSVCRCLSFTVYVMHFLPKFSYVFFVGLLYASLLHHPSVRPSVCMSVCL